MTAGTALSGESPHAANSSARLAAVQSLYEIEISGAALDQILEDFLEHRWAAAGNEKLAEADRRKFVELIRGVTEDKAKLDEMLVGALAPDNENARLDKVLRTILRAGAWELAYRPRLPLAVIVDEYVELCHAFHGGNEPKLVNGVLDRLGKILRPPTSNENSEEPEADK